MPKANLPAHGARILPGVSVDSYNLEIEDNGGFVGDKANKAAFWEILSSWRGPLSKAGKDPLGKKPAEEIGKEKLAQLLAKGDPLSAAIVASAVEGFAGELASVIRRYMRLKQWKKIECIVIGGGFSAGRLGKLAIARAELLLRGEGVRLDLMTIENHPDEAGLIGAIHLLPSWMLDGHNGLIAVDIGGTNFRAGIVKFRKSAAKPMKAKVFKAEVWRHGDKDIDRDAAARKLVRMLKSLIDRAYRHRIRLVPIVAIACPGIIDEDGSIQRGGQNLPGNWESRNFNLPATIQNRIPRIGKSETLVIMHNDAVVQGLSELPRAGDRKRWGVLTIGTGLGNASFTNRKEKEAGKS